MQPRWCFCKDDDGHWFLLPIELRAKFMADMKEAYSSDDFSGVAWVDEYRSNDPRFYSFEHPLWTM